MGKIITVKECPMCEHTKKTGELCHRTPIDCLSPGKYEVTDDEFCTEYKPLD